MTKKDVLMMCQFFYPEYITSAILPYQTATALTDKGIDVDVITGYPKEYSNKKNVKKNENVNNINIKRVNYLQLSRGTLVSRLINYFSFIVSMFFQLPKIKEYKVLMIYSNPPILPIIALIANKLFNTKIVFVAYDLYPEIGIKTEKMSENGLLTTIMNWINKRLYPKAEVVALSNEMKEFIINNRDISPDRVHVINNWATEEKNEKTNKVKMNESKSPFIISYLGNMGIPQEFDTLLNAMADERIKKNDIELHLAGHGNQREKISKYIKDNNLSNVFLHGYLQNEEFDNLADKTDTFFLSLKDRLNGLAVPSKYYTYLLSRKPILAVINQSSDISQEINYHKIGYTANENNVDELVDAILKIRKMKYPSKDIYYSNYSKDIQLKKYINLIEKILVQDEKGLENDYIQR